MVTEVKDGCWIVQACFPRAQEVYLLGDFNNWSTTATRLNHLGKGVFEAKLHLEPHPQEPTEPVEGAKPAETATPLGSSPAPQRQRFSRLGSLPDIAFFVWEHGQRIGRLVHHDRFALAPQA